MAGKDILQGAQPVEWVEETEFATAEADASWQWFGIVSSWNTTPGVETETIPYLPEANASNKLEKQMNVALHEIYEGDLTYNPQNFDLLQYFTGDNGGTSDSLDSIQIGEIDELNDEYRRELGCVGEEFSFSVDEGSVAEVSASFMIADAEDWEETDYVGEGSHASEDSSEPFKFGDLSNIELNNESLDDAVEGLEFTVSNNLEITRDPDAPRGTYIEAITPTNREITVDLTLTYSSFDMAEAVRNYTEHTLTFDVDDVSFTIEGVQFPEFPFELTPEDLVSDSLTSDPCSSISWA